MGSLWRPFDSLFPLPPTPEKALSKWLQLTIAPFSRRENLIRPDPLPSLPQSGSLTLWGRVRNPRPDSISPKLRGGKTHKPGDRPHLQVKVPTPPHYYLSLYPPFWSLTPLTANLPRALLSLLQVWDCICRE